VCGGFFDDPNSTFTRSPNAHKATCCEPIFSTRLTTPIIGRRDVLIFHGKYNDEYTRETHINNIGDHSNTLFENVANDYLILFIIKRAYYPLNLYDEPEQKILHMHHHHKKK